MNKFISYEEFKIIYNLQVEGIPAESSFLKFKQDVSSNYGPINSNRKYPPQFWIKMSQTGFFKHPLKFLKKRRKGRKITGLCLGRIRLKFNPSNGGNL